MARQRKTKTKTPSIAREEWDFSGVPDFLKFDCWAYEYSREAMRIGTKLPGVVFDLLPNYRPNKSLPFMKRAGVLRAIEAFNKKKAESEGKGKFVAKSLLPREVYKRGYDLSVSVGPMEGRDNFLLSIDLDMEATALAKDFQELLGRWQKNKKLKTRRGGMPAQIRQRSAELKWLGALRILNAGFTADGAAGETQHICGDPLYEEEARWYDARKSANRVLSEWPSPLIGNIFQGET